MTGTKALLTWAYDGSGVALRVPCTIVHAEAHGEAVVLVETAEPEVVAALKTSYETDWKKKGGKFVAYIGCALAHLTPLGSPPALTSWNWND